jgi:hypothetical protein
MPGITRDSRGYIKSGITVEVILEEGIQSKYLMVM